MASTRERIDVAPHVGGKLLRDSLLAACFLGFTGCLAGAFVLPSLERIGALLGAPNVFPEGWWAYGVLGVVGGGIGGFVKSWAEIGRQQALREHAKDMGLVFSYEAAQELESGLRSLIDQDYSFSVSNVLQKDVPGAKFYVADLAIRVPSSDADSRYQQTVAYSETSGGTFPTFLMQPEGRMLRAISLLVPLADINYDDFPEFSRQYHLSGDNPEAVRSLFTRPLLEHFSQATGWQIQARGNRLLMFRPRRLCRADELPQFVAEALEVFSMLLDAQQQAAGAVDVAQREAPLAAGRNDRYSDLSASTVAEDAAPSGCDAWHDFLAQPPPRSLPAALRGRHTGCVTMFLMVWGLLFGALGGIVGMALLMDGQWLGGLFGSLFPLIGFSVLYFTYRRVARRKQLLREGRLADAWIQSLEPTNLYINNQRRYRLGLRLALPAGEEHRSVSIYGPLVRRAEDRLSGNEPMQVLYLPGHPERFMLVDSLLPVTPARGMM